jgi:hypothetical protein
MRSMVPESKIIFLNIHRVQYPKHHAHPRRPRLCPVTFDSCSGNTMTTNIASYWNLWVGILLRFHPGTHFSVTMLKSKPFRRTRNSQARNGSPT